MTARILRERRAGKDARLLDLEILEPGKPAVHATARSLGVLTVEARHRDGTPLAADLYPAVTEAVRTFVDGRNIRTSSTESQLPLTFGCLSAAERGEAS